MVKKHFGKWREYKNNVLTFYDAAFLISKRGRWKIMRQGKFRGVWFDFVMKVGNFKVKTFQIEIFNRSFLKEDLNF